MGKLKEPSQASSAVPAVCHRFVQHSCGYRRGKTSQFQAEATSLHMEVDEPTELSIVVIIPEGESPPAVMPVTLSAADTIDSLKERVEANSNGQRPKAKQMILSWGQELE